MTEPATRGTTNRNDRGSAAERRARKQWLVNTYGDGRVVACSFPGCSRLLTVETVTVDRFPIPGCRGGTYRRGNIRPACGPCNSTHGGALRSAS